MSLAFFIDNKGAVKTMKLQMCRPFSWVIIFLFLFGLVSNNWAGQLRLFTMGNQAFLVPDSTTELFSNPHVASQFSKTFFEMEGYYQAKSYVSPIYKAESFVEPAKVALPDEIWSFSQIRMWHASGHFRKGKHHFVVQLYHLQMNLPSSNIQPIHLESVFQPLSTVQSNKIVLGYIRPISSRLVVGIYGSPFNTLPFPDPYRIGTDYFSNKMTFRNPKAWDLALAIGYRVHPRVQFHFYVQHEKYNWFIPAEDVKGYFRNYQAKFHLTWITPLHTQFRLLFSAKKFSGKFAKIYPVEGYPISLIIDEEHFQIQFFHYSTPHFLYAAGVSYSSMGKIKVGTGWYGEAGYLTLNRIYNQKVIHEPNQNLWRWKYFVFLDAPIMSILRFNSSFVIGNLVRNSSGIFRQTYQRNLSRVVSFGMVIQPWKQLAVEMAVIPEIGSDIISSFRNQRNFYGFSIHFGK